ncbi:MAG: DUF2797 domain-containing protein [Thermoplasmata archaeon]
MFRRADQLLIEKVEDEFPLHVLDFYWDEFEPGLTCYDTRDCEVSELDLRKVEFAVSKKRICVGYFDDDRYVRCPKSSAVTRFPQCPECSEESFLPFQACVFEPRCDGEICDLDFCRREHVLYVAFYDTRMKIGMSSTRRVERRLIEQGADAFAILGKFATRKKAREAEKSISARLRLPQYVRQDAVLRSYSRPVDTGGIDGRYEALKITLSEAYSLDVEPLRWLEGYPIHLPLPHVPKLQEPWGSHKGELVGIKGKWMIYDGDGLKALNLSALEARFLSRDLP